MEKKQLTSQAIQEELEVQNKDISVKKKNLLVDQAKIKPAVRDWQQDEGSDDIVGQVMRLQVM